MTPEERSAFATLGGKAIARNHALTIERGRKGGLAVSKNKAHMAEIGRRGGLHTKKPKPIPASPFVKGLK